MTLYSPRYYIMYMTIDMLTSMYTGKAEIEGCRAEHASYKIASSQCNMVAGFSGD